jgi:hypothetical protein
MRKTHLAFIIIVLLLGVAPLGVGIFYKQRYLQIVSILNNDTTKQITVTEYHIGWLSSTIKGIISPKKSDADPSRTLLGFNFENTVIHGPIIYDAKQHNIKFGIALMHGKVFAAPLNQLLGVPTDQGLIETTTFTKWNSIFNPGFTMQLAILPGNLRLASDINLAWKEIDGVIQVDIANNHITQMNSTLKSNGMEGQMGSMNVSYAGIGIDTASKATAMPGIWEVAYNNTVVNGSYKDQSQNILSFDAVNVLAQTSLEQNTLYKLLLNVTTNKMVAENVAIDPASIHLLISGINADSLSKLILSKDYVAQEDLIYALFTPSTKISGDLDVATSIGNVSGYFEVNCPVTDAVKKPEDVLSKINGHLLLRMTPSFALYVVRVLQEMQLPLPVLATSPTDAESLVNAFLTKGYFKKENDLYVMDAVGNATSIKLNGIEAMPSTPLPPAPSLSPTAPIPPAPLH